MAAIHSNSYVMLVPAIHSLEYSCIPNTLERSDWMSFYRMCKMCENLSAGWWLCREGEAVWLAWCTGDPDEPWYIKINVALFSHRSSSSHSLHFNESEGNAISLHLDSATLQLFVPNYSSIFSWLPCPEYSVCILFLPPKCQPASQEDRVLLKWNPAECCTQLEGWVIKLKVPHFTTRC